MSILYLKLQMLTFYISYVDTAFKDQKNKEFI